MDLHTLMIGAAIVVVSAVVLYLISVCSMKERTYEVRELPARQATRRGRGRAHHPVLPAFPKE